MSLFVKFCVGFAVFSASVAGVLGVSLAVMEAKCAAVARRCEDGFIETMKRESGDRGCVVCGAALRELERHDCMCNSCVIAAAARL